MLIYFSIFHFEIYFVTGNFKEILDTLQNKTRKAKKEDFKESKNRHGHRNSTIDNDEKKNFNITSPLTSEEMIEDIILKLEKLGAKSKNIMDKLNEKFNKTKNYTTKKKREIFVETARNLLQPTEEHENMAKEEVRLMYFFNI